MTDPLPDLTFRTLHCNTSDPPQPRDEQGDEQAPGRKAHQGYVPLVVGHPSTSELLVHRVVVNRA